MCYFVTHVIFLARPTQNEVLGNLVAVAFLFGYLLTFFRAVEFAWAPWALLAFPVCRCLAASLTRRFKVESILRRAVIKTERRKKINGIWLCHVNHFPRSLRPRCSPAKRSAFLCLRTDVPECVAIYYINKYIPNYL